MEREPYIGICDFTDAGQARAMLHLFRSLRKPNSKRILMVGLMMSYKTLNGLPTQWADIFPRKERIHEIFVYDLLALNTLHYADYEGVDVLRSLTRATEFGGPNMNAIQLDMIWPDPVIIEAYKKAHPYIHIVLQVPEKAFDEVQNDSAVFVRRMQAYRNTVSYVLLDKSMGRGLGMDAEGLRPFVKAMRISFPHIGVGGAGGLGPTTMDLVRPLANEFSNINIDAQSKLRPSGDARDPIDWDYAATYLEKASEILP